jgi:hypothetical protein
MQVTAIVDHNLLYDSETNQLAFVTPPFLGGISAEDCEISPHNSDFLYIFLINHGKFAL